MSSLVLRPAARVGSLAVAVALALPLLALPNAGPARAVSCDATVVNGYGGGDGSADPYLVCSAAHIEHLAATSGDWDKKFLQTADIELSSPHTPIGNDFTTTPFTGTYDGGGFRISGLMVDGGSDGQQGFFGVTRDATLTGIRIVDAEVKGGNTGVGALVGRAFATTIEDSSVSGASTVEGTGELGGLVGDATPAFGVGGSISNSFSTADVVGNGNRVGGLVGNSNTYSITASFATGPVENAGNRTGGLAGGVSSSPISASYASGPVIGTTNVGGLVGYVEGSTNPTIDDSYATGAVQGTTDHVAGLVGRIANPAVVISRSFATGRVTVDAGATQVGGLVGNTELSSSPLDAAVASFWDSSTTGLATSGGGSGAVGRTTAQMRSISTFSGASTPWSIIAGGVGQSGDVWGICPGVNDGYPFLLWQTSAADCQPTGSTQQGPVLSFFAPGGVLPLVSPGLGEWVQSDGSSVPLAVSSPGVNQVRYSADGIQVTLTGGAGSGVSRGLVANPAGEVVCEVCTPFAAGGVIEAWMFSTPRLVAAHLTQDLPCQTFAIPVVAPLDGGGPVSVGAHTLQLALPSASGMQAVNVGVTVGSLLPTSVRAGEGPVGEVTLAWGRLFLLLGLLGGVGAAMTSRRERGVVTG
jgi:hypothetical protein